MVETNPADEPSSQRERALIEGAVSEVLDSESPTASGPQHSGEDVARTVAFDPVDNDAEFELGIDLIVAGIEQRAASLRAERLVSSGQLGPASAAQFPLGQP